MKSRCLTVLCCVAALSVTGAALGEAQNDKSRELETLQNEIRGTEQALSALKVRRSDLAEQLGELERRYGRLARSLETLELQAREQERQILELKKRKQALREHILKHQRTLIGQTRAAYANGRQEWLKLLLNQDDPNRCSRMLAYFGFLQRARAGQLETLKDSLSGTLELEAALTAEARRLDATRERITKEKTELEAARRERHALMRVIESDLKNQGDRLRQLKEDAQRLQALIATLPRPAASLLPQDRTPTTAEASTIEWPVQGPLLARFGEPRLSGQWDGVLIGAPEGTPVRAVASGRVVFADWLRGYGLLTIIDHGNGYLSLYAFTQSLHKSLGDWVQAGDVIATVGASGGRSEPALYFAVRENGHPIDPLQWSGRGH